MTTLARWSFRHRFIVVLLWIAALLALGVTTRLAGKDYTDGFSLPGTDSSTAQQLVSPAGDASGSGDDTVVFHTSPQQPVLTDSDIRSRITSAIKAASSLSGVASVDGPYTAGQLSADGRTAFATVTFTTADQALTVTDITPFVDAFEPVRRSGIDVEFGGGAFQTLKGSPVSGSVAIGLIAAAIIMLLAFGSVLAAALPLVSAIFAVGAGVETVALLSHALSINSITPSIAALIGIGVAVDYALFIVTRHRDGLRSGLTPEESAIRALSTSGRAVAFAGMTVAIAMLGLLLLRVDFLTGVGLAAAITVAYAVLAALTLIPALFGVLGERVLSRRERRTRAQPSSDDRATARSSAGWQRWARVVEGHPVLLSAIALAVMLILAIPTLDLRLGASDQGNDPASSTTRKAYDLLADGFGAGYNGPLVIAAQTPDRQARQAFGDLADKLSDSSAVASVDGPDLSSPGVEVLRVISSTSPQSTQTADLITNLRDSVIPAAEQGTRLRAYIGGQTAVFQDFASVLSAKLPLFLAVIVLLGCLLLMIAFRSIAIPLVAAAMNILAAAASFGVVVAIFQWGWGLEAIGLGAPGPIEAFLPVMLIAILFGLSMDYQVFLVSRMHEEWERTHDNSRAVRAGQVATGKVITAAAAIMVVVFLAFVLEGRRPIGEFGLGLAVAILLDALVLRTILVPATMHLLGSANWWLPGRIQTALPHLDLDSTRPAATSSAGVDEPATATNP